ncbi:MAG TPA: hypothetical protein DDX92_04110 [Flavobacteriales bacterium]|jgi:hypothetical protein|nr:hypothetical protein [Flavobacteriales bacterium]
MSSYGYVGGNPISFIDPDGKNLTGYEGEDGSLIWDHRQNSETITQNGQTYTKVTEDYFEFSDIARSSGTRIEYQGILDVGNASFGDIIAAYAHIAQNRYSQSFSDRSSLIAREIFDISNISSSTGWNLNYGNVGGGVAIKDFHLNGQEVRVMMQTALPLDRIEHQGLPPSCLILSRGIRLNASITIPLKLKLFTSMKTICTAVPQTILERRIGK